MAEKKTQQEHRKVIKKTKQAYSNPKKSSMNKHNKRTYKEYRGQGK
jgi:hypothetical protein